MLFLDEIGLLPGVLQGKVLKVIEQAGEHLGIATAMYREMGMTYWLEKAEADLGK